MNINTEKISGRTAKLDGTEIAANKLQKLRPEFISRINANFQRKKSVVCNLQM